jgi:hypothetical protein
MFYFIVVLELLIIIGLEIASSKYPDFPYTTQFFVFEKDAPEGLE